MALLEIPFEQGRYLMSKYKSLGLRPRGGSLYIYPGALETLPRDLRQFATEDFSYARWLEDDENLKSGGPLTPTRRGSVVFKPRDHQMEGAKAIFKAHQRGWPGFLLADKTGIGKTLTSLVAVTAAAKKEGFTPQRKAQLLVVCPKGVIPVWRQTLHSYPVATAHLRVLIINYQQLNKLLKAPKSAGDAKKKKTKNRRTAKLGTPTVTWDYVIFDEAHSLKNYPSSGASMAGCSIARLNQPYLKGESPFVVYSTATPGSSPLNMALMAPWLARLLNPKASSEDCTPDGWAPFLLGEGFAVKEGKLSWSWAAIPWFGKDSDDPKERAKYAAGVRAAKARQRQDTRRIGEALRTPGAPFLMRSPTDIAGWPEQQLIPLPLELSQRARPLYEEAWETFRSWLKLHPKGSDSKGALVQQLRYRQKASLLKVDSMVENVVEFVENGNQVYVGVEFMDTLDRYKELLESKGVTTAEISGRNTQERTQERLRFQRGEAQVVLCTVVAGISLHAGETLPDGTTATHSPRVTVLHDVRQNPLDAIQALGRAHRDGQNSLSYIPFFEETVDEKVIYSFVNKHANMNTMLGSEEEEAEALEELFRNSSGQG